ncbi:MAG: SH3 domain-containing protein [Parasphingorhabdus sp.]|nr:SH3 domain-containing protein [Parasphingorhabdus sp.]
MRRDGLLVYRNRFQAGAVALRYMVLRIGRLTACLTFVGVAAPALAADAPPYWASIDEPEARMRTGPSTEFPTVWIYKRERLPVKVIARYKAWRKIEDPDGTQGWMHARLLSATRTAIVMGEIRALKARPDAGAALTWRVEPGVIGKISDCQRGWCLFDVNGQAGYIEEDFLWGEEPLKGK